VADPDAPLNSVAAGLRNPPVDGSFYITVADDATGTPVAYRIDVDLDGAGADTSLNDLIAAINGQVSGVTATLTADQRLSLTADQGFSFSFGHDGEQFRADSSQALAGLGVNTFFTGSNAADIAVTRRAARRFGAVRRCFAQPHRRRHQRRADGWGARRSQ
jgi:flagellar hook-associated protein 1 FlgK